MHSLLATEKCKQLIRPLLKNRFEYYRLCYSIIATISLCYILYYNFSIGSIFLWSVSFAEKIIAVVFTGVGLMIMLICMKKYFFDLSGINALLKKQDTEISLQVNGLNSYVRHPLYTGTLMFVFGIFLWQPLVSNLISFMCILLYTFIGAHFEERRLIRIFGNEYKIYALHVPMLLPSFW